MRTSPENAVDHLPNLEDLLAPHRRATEAELQAILDTRHAYVVPGAPPPAAGLAALRTMAAHQFETGGKRLRALLTPALVGAAHGPLPAAVAFGAAIECVHNGTLVHDDIQDGDRLRRGQPTLWTRHGIPQAINAGDALLVAPLALVLRSEAIAPPLRLQLAALLSDALLETIRGQVADIGLRDLERPNLHDITAVHIAKTGPLFGACFVGAALLLGLDRDALAAARDLGRDIGLAFQVRDDLLDVLGEKGRGQPGADLREGKWTFPFLLALQGAPADQADALFALLGRAATGEALTDAEVTQWLAWAHARGGVTAARAHLDQTLAHARLAARLAFPEAAAVVALALCDRLAALDG